METIQETIKSKQRAMIPPRLLKGSKILGDLWRSNVRCKSGWASGCSGEETDFCVTKRKWVELYIEYNGVDANWLASDSPFGVIEAMTVGQVSALDVNVTVETPEGNRIVVGPQGTEWQTIIELSALHGTPDYPATIQTVMGIQQALLRRA